MKNLFLVTLVSLSPLAASAADLVCSGMTNSDLEYRAEISLTASTAKIQSISRTGIVTLATLPCETLQSAARGNPSGPGPYMRCAEDGDDAGYLLELSTDDNVSGLLSQRTKNGKKPIVGVNCIFQ